MDTTTVLFFVFCGVCVLACGILIGIYIGESRRRSPVGIPDNLTLVIKQEQVPDPRAESIAKVITEYNQKVEAENKANSEETKKSNADFVDAVGRAIDEVLGKQ